MEQTLGLGLKIVPIPKQYENQKWKLLCTKYLRKSLKKKEKENLSHLFK